MKETVEELRNLFFRQYGIEPAISKISGGGSPREYYRMTNGDLSVVGVIGDDIKENTTFIKLDNLLSHNGIPVPEIFAVSKNKKCYLQQDLGAVSLFELLHGEDKISLAKEALDSLIKFQSIPEEEWEDVVGYSPFADRLVRWDLNYFKYDFLKPAGIQFDEDRLEDDFERLIEQLASPVFRQGLMYRDFQSRNIMVKENKLWLIDFQGARKGPMLYDAVSFIWQAKAPFSYEERERLGEYYLSLLSLGNEVEAKGMYIMQVFRTLQVLGAYGFRGLIERKSHFLESIPMAISNLNYLKEKGRLNNYPEIARIASKLEFFNRESSPLTKDDKGNQCKLTVSVSSFSYKKGYPVNKDGNGGGFMFDCRGIHNPGRYDEYKKLTGRDREVIEFLDRTNEANDFICRAVDIVVPSIEKYMERGFSSLQVGFGCTGGRHRSVFCTERFGEIIRKRFPQINVEIHHKEEREW